MKKKEEKKTAKQTNQLLSLQKNKSKYQILITRKTNKT